MIIAASAGTGGGTASFILTLVIIAVVIAAYWAPSIVALRRHVPNRGAVVVVNAFLGWTLIGWVVALAMACRAVPQPAATEVQPGHALHARSPGLTLDRRPRPSASAARTTFGGVDFGRRAYSTPPTPSRSAIRCRPRSSPGRITLIDGLRRGGLLSGHARGHQAGGLLGLDQRDLRRQGVMGGGQGAG